MEVVAGAIRSLVNTRALQHECEKVLHEAFLMPVLLYGPKTMIWRENERSSVMSVQMAISEVCWVLGEWMECQMGRLESCEE